MNYQTVHFQTENDDCEAWYVPAPVSSGLCIGFHAYDASKSSLLAVARAFHDAGYDVVLVDFPGSGGSSGDRTTHGFTEAYDVAGAVDYARNHWSPRIVVLYGQSMGGAAILRAVGELNVHPSGIIIESTYDRFLTTVGNRFHAIGLPAFPLARLLVFWGGVQLGYNAFSLNPEEYAASVHCPALLFQGGRDPRVSNSEAMNVFDHLAGPKQFELFEQSGHCGFQMEEPDRWWRAIRGFLSTLQPS